MKCEFKNTLQVCLGNGKVSHEVLVVYPDNTSDKFYLCRKCTDEIVIRANRYGYPCGMMNYRSVGRDNG